MAFMAGVWGVAERNFAFMRGKMLGNQLPKSDALWLMLPKLQAVVLCDNLTLG